MGQKYPAVLARRVVEMKGGGKGAVDKHHAFESRSRRRQIQMFRGEFSAPGNHDSSISHNALQAFAGRLANFSCGFQLESAALGQLEDGSRQGMLRISLHTRRQAQDVGFFKSRGAFYLVKCGIPVRQCPGLVENEGTAGVQMFEYGRILYDD